MGPKFCQKRSILHRFRDKCAFALTQKFKMAAKSGEKVIFCEKSQLDLADTLRVKNFVSQDKCAFASRLCIYPADQKFCQNRSILHHF